MEWGRYTKEYKDSFHPDMMVYYVRPDGTNGCVCDVKQFKQHKDEYKDCLLIIAPPNAPVYFRKG